MTQHPGSWDVYLFFMVEDFEALDCEVTSSAEAEQSRCSHLLLDRCSHLCGLAAVCPRLSHWGLRTEPGTALTSADQSGKIASSDMLFVLCPMQLRAASNFISSSTLTTAFYTYFFPYAWKIVENMNRVYFFSFYTGVIAW